MTLEEAIKHAEEKAKRGGKCGEDHAQLAEWLKELQKLRTVKTEERKEESTQNVPKEDLISRKAAIDAHYEYCNKHPDAGFPVWSLKILENLPAVEPDLSDYSDKLWKAAYERGKAEAQAERKTGRWVPVMNGRGGHCCNRCNGYAPSYMNGDEHLSDFCPYCGADMRGEQDE